VLVASGALGVEARLEQLDDLARDRRMRAHRVLHVGVGERRPRLAQVLRDRAQHGDLAPAQPGT
jgi:hypothetical protein